MPYEKLHKTITETLARYDETGREQRDESHEVWVGRYDEHNRIEKQINELGLASGLDDDDPEFAYNILNALRFAKWMMDNPDIVARMLHQ